MELPDTDKSKQIENANGHGDPSGLFVMAGLFACVGAGMIWGNVGVGAVLLALGAYCLAAHAISLIDT